MKVDQMDESGWKGIKGMKVGKSRYVQWTKVDEMDENGWNGWKWMKMDESG